MIRYLLLVILLSTQAWPAFSAGAPFVGEGFDGIACSGNLKSTTGPYDYLSRGKLSKQLQLTEKFHFTPRVEQLKSGQSTAKAQDDIYFTLRIWPNHHRALNAISRYDKKMKAKGKRVSTPAECWLQRAANFSPKDAITRQLLAIYLHRADKLSLAHEHYVIAEELAPGDGAIAYNHGLLLVEMKDFDAAMIRAEKAYSMGFPLPGLKRQLADAGYKLDSP